MTTSEKKPAANDGRVDLLAEMSIPKSWSRERQLAAVGQLVLPVGRPDLDNICKTVDGLVGIAICDDDQIVELRARKIYCATPKLTIAVSPLAASPSNRRATS